MRNARQLRRAVFQANTRAGTDRINVRRSFALNRGGGSGSGPFSGDLEVNDDLRVFGYGNTIRLKRLSRLFDVNSSGTRLAVNGLTLRGGSPERTNDNGGFFSSAGTLVLNRTRLIQGRVPGDGSDGGASGGAVFNDAGTLVLRNSFIRGGRAVRAGGAIEASGASETVILDSTLRYNYAGYGAGAAPGNGGAFHQTGTGSLSVFRSQVKFNRAASEGGGLWNSTGAMRVNDSRVNRNVANGDDADTGGGGLFNNGGTLTLNGGQVFNNVAGGTSGSGGGILTVAGGDLSASGTTMKGNRANRAGGAIEANDGGGQETVNLTNVRLLENVAGGAGANPGNGGAVHLTGAARSSSLDIVNSVVSGNVAASEGGGLWNDSGWTMRVIDTRIAANDARGDAADTGGGGLFNNGGDLVVSDSSVIVDNTATGTSGSGGGVLNTADGQLTVRGSTLAGNTANRAGGGIETTGGTVDVDDTELRNNDAASNPGNGGAIHSAAGTVTVDGGRITGNTAANEGGGVWNGNGDTTVSGTTFDGDGGNTAGAEGDDAYNDGSGTLTVNGAAVAAGTGLDDAPEPQ